MDNGLFTLGAPHDSGDGPSPEEELTAFIVNDKSVIFKSGYGKYLKIEKDGIITGRSGELTLLKSIKQNINCIFFLQRQLEVKNNGNQFGRTGKWHYLEPPLVSCQLIQKMML